MLKKSLSLVFVSLLLVSAASFISAQNPLDGLAGQIEDTTGKIEDTADKIKDMTREDYKWEVLTEKLQEMLLKNPVVAKIDEILKKGNIVFVILFGRDYSLSLTLVFLIVLWFYFWSQFSKIIGTFSTFSSGTSMIISLGMVVIMAQLKFFDWASQMIFKLVFYREGIWGIIWGVVGFFAVILVAGMFGKFFSSLKVSVRKLKDEKYRKKLLGELEEKNKFFAIVSDAFRGMFTKD